MKKRNMILIMAICLISVLSAADSPAAIISTTGSISIIDPAPAVYLGAYESDNIIIFNEVQDLVLGTNIAVDITTPGTYPVDPLTPGSIPSGTHVNSYFLHLDPRGSPASVTLSGYVTFREPILGVIVSNSGLDASDAPLGADGTTYPTGTPARNLELNPDVVILWSPPSTLSVALNSVYADLDQVRVITGRLPLAVDVDPRTCPNPLRVRGGGNNLSVAILSTSDFDVTSVDPNSVRLMGVAPIRNRVHDVATPFYPFTGKQYATDCTDQGRDGFDDLLMSFSKSDILYALGPVLNDGDVHVLQLTGRLVDGTAINGEDVVVIRR